MSMDFKQFQKLLPYFCQFKNINSLDWLFLLQELLDIPLGSIVWQCKEWLHIRLFHKLKKIPLKHDLINFHLSKQLCIVYENLREKLDVKYYTRDKFIT